MVGGVSKEVVFEIGSIKQMTGIFLDISISSSAGISESGEEFRVSADIKSQETDCGILKIDESSVVHRCASKKVSGKGINASIELEPSMRIQPDRYFLDVELKRFRSEEQESTGGKVSGGTNGGGGFIDGPVEENRSEEEKGIDKCGESGRWVCGEFEQCSGGERTRICRLERCNRTVKTAEEVEECSHGNIRSNRTNRTAVKSFGQQESIVERFTGYSSILGGNSLLFLSITLTAGLVIVLRRWDN